MGDVVLNALEFTKGIDGFYDRFEKRFRTRMKVLVEEGMRRLLRRTPVHTGQAVMNYVASVGSPSGTGVKQGFDPVESTNNLTLGTEQLRGRAEAISKATLAMVNYNSPYEVFWIVNKSPNIAGLENGELPEAPYTPRSPQGMFGVTLQELSNYMNSRPI